MAPHDADDLLDAAEREGWSSRELRQQVTRFKNAGRHRGEVFNPEQGGEIKDLFDAAERGLKFGTIYADPPWLRACLRIESPRIESRSNPL